MTPKFCGRMLSTTEDKAAGWQQRQEGADLNQIETLIEKAVIKGMLEGQHRAVDAALHAPEADQDMAHKIATAIRKKNDALIANLSSLR